MDLTQQHHEDPTADGAARSAQLAAMVLSITEAAARLKAERLAGRAADDERAAAGVRAQHRAEQAVAWLTGRATAPTAFSPSAPASTGTGSVTIICTPRDPG